ncbi:MAG: GDP-mannose 4,6-dehydratase, partial [Bacteroidales bacterium]|nr:GDP-mannose 4,6-dehydratase [Bacteroidales bacterium]
MKTIIITGSAGLIGNESVEFFHNKGYQIVGIDNDMRAYFFGKNASTSWLTDLQKEKLQNFNYYDIDIRDYQKLEKIFK